MKLKLILSLLFLLPRNLLAFKSIEEQAKELTVKVVSLPEGLLNRGGQGSGVFVGPGLILTCAHVVSSSNVVVFTNLDSKYYKASILFKKEDIDLAVLKIELENKNFSLLQPDFKIGQKLIIVGSPSYYDFRISRSNIISHTYLRNPNKYLSPLIMFKCEGVTFGFSGGPIFNLSGELLGIQQMSSYDGEFCMGISVNEILKAIN